MENNTLSIFISGDFCPIHRMENLLSLTDLDSVFGSLLENIRSSDLAITNLESPLTKHTIPINKTGPALKGSPKASKFLKSAGFNLVTLANNHIMDFGRKGLEDTIQQLKKDEVSYVGAGLSGNKALSPFYFEKNGVKIAIINVSENEWSTTTDDRAGANPINPVENFYQIKEAKKLVDKVIVISHGGHEMNELPSPRMKKLFRYYVDAGADAVINHHMHCISGFEVYENCPIFYSLGNFIFDNPSYRNTIWNIGMAINLSIDKNEIRFEPVFFHQCNQNPGIQTFTEEELKNIHVKMNSLNKTILNDQKLEESFNLYVKSKFKLYNSYMEPRGNKYILALQNRKLLPSLWSKRKRRYLLNLVRCEAHRDMLIRILQNENSNT